MLTCDSGAFVRCVDYTWPRRPGITALDGLFEVDETIIIIITCQAARGLYVTLPEEHLGRWEP